MESLQVSVSLYFISVAWLSFCLSVEYNDITPTLLSSHNHMILSNRAVTYVYHKLWLLGA